MWRVEDDQAETFVREWHVAEVVLRIRLDANSSSAANVVFSFADIIRQQVRCCRVKVEEFAAAADIKNLFINFHSFPFPHTTASVAAFKLLRG